MPIFTLVFFVIFTGLHAVLMLGIFSEWRRDKKARKAVFAEFPKVSVIVPVHNEESRIEGLLKSLECQDYPRAEVIFVDDRSSDKSAALMAGFIKGKKNARLVSISDNPGPNFKQFALERGIASSSGDFILFTDADCILPPRWIEGMVKRMADKKTGVVIAPVLKSPAGKGFLHLYQCFEHGIRFMYLAAATGLGAAGGGFGNNLIVRRSSLDAVGGYEKVPPSPTEDAALVARIRSRSGCRIRAAVLPDVHVITREEKTWKALVNQTLRWNNGGLFSSDIATRLNYSFLMITIAMGILAVPPLLFFPFLWPLPLAVLVSMIFNTGAVMLLFSASLPKRRFAYIPALLFTPVYFVFLTMIGFLGVKSEWKGKKF